MKHTLRSFVSTFILLVSAGALSAQTTATWVGFTGDWHIASNWDTNVVPTSADETYFNSQGVANITVSGNAEARSINVNSSYAYTFTITNSATFTVYDEGIGSSSLADRSTFVIDAGATLASRYTLGNSVISNSGTLLIDGGHGGNSQITTYAGGTVLFANDGYGGSANFDTRAGGSVRFDTGSTLGGAGSITGAGSYVLAGIGSELSLNDEELTTNVSGAITGGGTIIKDGNNGDFTLSGSEDNTGLSLSVQRGTAWLAKDSSASVHAVGNIASVNSGYYLNLAGTGGDQIADTGDIAQMDGNLDMNGRSETINGLSGEGWIYNQGGTTSTLTVGAANATGTALAFTGSINDGNSPIALRKVGTGTLTLSGVNSYYSGGTTISGGVVLLHGDPASFPGDTATIGTGAVTVQNGATLAGSDSIAGMVTIEHGGHLAPGSFADSGGILRLNGGLTLNDGAILDFRLTQNTDYQLRMGLNMVDDTAVMGELFGPAGGKIVINFYQGADFALGTYDLLYFGGITPTNFDLANNFEVHGFGGYDYELWLGGGYLGVTVTAGAIPEPSTCAALAGAAALGLAVVRRRRQVAGRASF